MNKKELKELLKEDKKNYDCNDIFHYLYYWFISEKKYQFYAVLKATRKYEFYKNKNGIIGKLLAIFYLRKFNLLSQKYRIYIKSKVEHNLKIWHENIIINPYAKIGNNVQLHGNNCIGNDGKDLKKCPIIGDNVWIGINAVVVGKIEIGNDVLIAPNSYVNFNVPDHSIVIGNPGRIIPKENATEGYINNTI